MVTRTPDETEKQMEVTKIRDLPDSATGARRALYKLDPPYEVRDWDGEVECVAEFVVVSAVNAMFTGPETYIFPADETGRVTSWAELEGSYRGGYDHEQAINGLLEWVNVRSSSGE